eukprot:TRINITY_DN22220_c0_g1_i1.p1 TRINITY_DN22220_c0_g1~~TRINITY_DN22220_c0_g1_i1.p1  ORF type:complete len:980 (+),score=172.72 TRINITY_DN22220_c0_g1_i1:93-3032(+)
MVLKFTDVLSTARSNATQEASQPSVQAESWSVVLPAVSIEEKTPRSLDCGLKHLTAAQRAQRLKKPSELPETPREVLPPSLSFLGCHGTHPQAVTSRDLLKSNLHQDMGGLKLAEYFDSYGKPRFRKLGLTFAAKQILPKDSMKSCSHRTEAIREEFEHTEEFAAAKAFIIAQEAVAKDARVWKKKTREFAHAISDTERYKDKEVRSRQVAIFFLEVANFLTLLPRAVSMDLLELAILREDDTRTRFAAGRAAGFLQERGVSQINHANLMGWRLGLPQFQALADVMQLWVNAAWSTPGVGAAGMDRACFCRFVLDIGIVDQQRVPYFWAVSLFDQMSHSMRFSSPEDPVTAAPMLQIVNRWELISIMDTLIHAHFRPNDTSGRSKFIKSLLAIANLKLPAFVMTQSALQEKWTLHLKGDEDAEEDGKPSTGKANSKDKDRKSQKDKSPREGQPSNEKPHERRAKHNEDEAAAAAEARVDPPRLIEEQQREQRLLSMMVEPEALVLLWQHEEIFKLLHRSYADEPGHMTGQAVAQFCGDFFLAPKLISMHALGKMYESCKCYDLRAGDDSEDVLRSVMDVSVDGMQETSRSRRSVMDMSADDLQETSRSRKSSIKSAMSVTTDLRGAPPSSRRNSKAALVHRPSVVAQTHNKRGSVAASRPRQLRRRSLQSAKGEHASETETSRDSLGSIGNPVKLEDKTRVSRELYTGPWPPTFPWEKIAEYAERVQDGAPSISAKPSCFGPQALMEMVCKIAFTHVAFYGNIQQRSMSGALPTTWMLVYLRFVTESLRKSLDKRKLSKQAEEERYGALSRAVRGLHIDSWGLSVPDLNDEDDEAKPQPTVFREPVRNTPESMGLLPPKKVYDPETAPKLGSPCVVDGTCRLCGNSGISMSDWGNIRCHGCSKLDTLSLKHHPLAPLVVGRPPWQQLEAVSSGPIRRVRNSSLSPPRTRESDSLSSSLVQQATSARKAWRVAADLTKKH